MASVVDICNRALQKLGATRITSLTDGSNNARQLSTAYDMRRQAVLAKHPWNFATQRFSLAATGTAPPFGPANAFTLPTGWLRVLPPDPSENFTDRDWIIEGNTLMTNQGAPLHLRCVMDVTDTTLFHPLFSEALASDLAYELCEAITQSNAKKEAAAADKKAAIDDAKKVNAIQKVPAVAPDASWLARRV